MRLPRIIILVAAVAFAGWVFYSLVHVEPVQVIQSGLHHENGEVFVDGKIENTGADTGPIDLEVHYYDVNGRPLGQDKVVVEKLPKGLPTRFSTPKRALGDVADFSIYLNHGRNPYGN